MRLPVVLLVALALAGCASDPAPAAEPQASPGDAAAGFRLPVDAAAQPRMRFAGEESSQTVAYQDAWPTPDTCFPNACPEQEVRFDLTDQVPAEAPVDLTAAITTRDNFGAWLEVTDGSVVRLSQDEHGVAATLVRKPAGEVTLVVFHGSVLSAEPGATTVPVTAEVTTVVRPDTVPAFLPMLIDLAVGDQLLAMGPDVEELVVVPPGQDPVHLLDGFGFNVSASMPAGTYLVMVKGGEGMLHGPNATLRPAYVTWAAGEPHALPSGQDVAWTTSVPGVPIAVGISIFSEPGGAPGVNYLGAFSMHASQRGTELVLMETNCPAVCNLGVSPFGYSSSSSGSSLLPEGMVRGDIDVVVTNSMSAGYYAQDWVAYVEA